MQMNFLVYALVNKLISKADLIMEDGVLLLFLIRKLYLYCLRNDNVNSSLACHCLSFSGSLSAQQLNLIEASNKKD